MKKLAVFVMLVLSLLMSVATVSAWSNMGGIYQHNYKSHYGYGGHSNHYGYGGYYGGYYYPRYYGSYYSYRPYRMYGYGWHRPYYYGYGWHRPYYHRTWYW